MTDKDISKFGEIQYLKGRLDELFKALPTVFDVSRSRKLDQRVEKYLIKLRNVEKVNKRILKKYSELNEEMQKLISDYNTNQLIYSAKFNFEPLIGETYHLYSGKDGNLSILYKYNKNVLIHEIEEKPSSAIFILNTTS